MERLFFPDFNSIGDKYNQLLNKFGFLSSISDTVSEITNIFNLSYENPEPPVIYMDLSQAESEYDYGDRAVALDLSWYARYKPTVDNLLSALMWGFFIWNTYTHIPDILNGGSLLVRESNKFNTPPSDPGDYKRISGK